MSMTAQKSETIEVHMARKKWRLSKLAREAGLSSAVVRKAMNGEKIRPNTAAAIARALDVELSQIEGLNY